MERTIVRCDSGAFYSTIWIPLVSFKAIRFGSARFQRCPVHRRWERAVQVDVAALTYDERRQAKSTVDIGIP
ncbi:hypothetical protein [Williamsia phyllosphaerae]|uniref:Uncharacterized protein n=1 Tax=Williamsia phyllosphaerae TaxID=885042 RepID=A0ABQ1V856_9NOCA|nr:hypothetical protein [Williamsia phyllosphaerae]GGF43477.1 hypothetical protein GCM10007298_43940 [Williamsia phyllosphaerae]